MPFIGNQPALSYTSFAKQDFTTSATTSYTLDNPVANANELALFINFVRQEPTTAYSASGTSLTLTSATSATDDMYCVYLGKAVQTVNPPNASVGTSQLVDNGVTTAKIANDAVTKAKTSALMYPAFEAALSTNQTGIVDNVITKIQFADETFDTDSCYDNVTNYRFTPTVAGKYFFYGSAACNGGTSNLRDGAMYLYKNGAELQSSYSGFEDNYLNNVSISFHGVHEANGTTDYFEAFARIDTQNSSDGQLDEGGNNFRTIFGAYRIGD